MIWKYCRSFKRVWWIEGIYVYEKIYNFKKFQFHLVHHICKIDFYINMKLEVVKKIKTDFHCLKQFTNFSKRKRKKVIVHSILLKMLTKTFKSVNLGQTLKMRKTLGKIIFFPLICSSCCCYWSPKLHILSFQTCFHAPTWCMQALDIIPCCHYKVIYIKKKVVWVGSGGMVSMQALHSLHPWWHSPESTATTCDFSVSAKWYKTTKTLPSGHLSNWIPRGNCSSES